jgi:hypothetical protein
MPASAQIIGRLFTGLFFEIIYAPVWWYSAGLAWFVGRVGASIKETSISAGLGIWVKNLFVPMYGQYDVWGRIMSFFVRFTNIIVRSLWVGLWVALCFVAICVWVALPPALFFIFISSLIRRAYV